MVIDSGLERKYYALLLAVCVFLVGALGPLIAEGFGILGHDTAESIYLIVTLTLIWLWIVVIPSAVLASIAVLIWGRRGQRLRALGWCAAVPAFGLLANSVAPAGVLAEAAVGLLALAVVCGLPVYWTLRPAAARFERGGTSTPSSHDDGGPTSFLSSG
jgi:hypothetical protein